MLFNLLKKTKSVKELNNLYVVVFGISLVFFIVQFSIDNWRSLLLYLISSKF